ncbi:hypothetical protein C1632_10190 [Microbacterium testaceum]|nr:hypothetical protein C1632_10190 [Microbacterium testaceum]
MMIGKFLKPVADAIVSFTDAFRLGTLKKQLLTEQVARENIQNAIEDSTIELSVQEKFLRAEALHLDNELKREEVRAQRLANIERTLELSRRIREAQVEARGSDPSVPIWDEREATAIADNVRLLASIDLADKADFTVRLADDGDQFLSGGR